MVKSYFQNWMLDVLVGKKKNWKPAVLVERYHWLSKVHKSVYFNQIYSCSSQEIGWCLKNKIETLHFRCLYSLINTRIINCFFRSSSHPNTSLKKNTKEKAQFVFLTISFELKIKNCWKINQKRNSFER